METLEDIMLTCSDCADLVLDDALRVVERARAVVDDEAEGDDVDVVVAESNLDEGMRGDWFWTCILLE